jgi:hypothetical protein
MKDVEEMCRDQVWLWSYTQSCIEMIDLSNTLRHGPTHSHV